jgi:hypothetical protein
VVGAALVRWSVSSVLEGWSVSGLQAWNVQAKGRGAGGGGQASGVVETVAGKAGTLATALFLVLTTTTLVSFTLRETHIRYPPARFPSGRKAAHPPCSLIRAHSLYSKCLYSSWRPYTLITARSQTEVKAVRRPTLPVQAAEPYRRPSRDQRACTRGTSNDDVTRRGQT